MTPSPKDPSSPCYPISVAARMVDLHPQTLRKYEQEGLVEPQRSPGNIRLYSPNDVARLRKITRLTTDLGVNLAGVHVILNLTEQIEVLQEEKAMLRGQLAALQHPPSLPAGDDEQEV